MAMGQRCLVPSYVLFRLGVVLLSSVTPLAHSLESLATTFEPQSPASGLMFDIAATGNNAITITGFASYLNFPGPVSNYQVWVARDGVAGNTTDLSAWTLVASTDAFVISEQWTLTALPFSSPLSIRLTPGSRIGIYLTTTDDAPPNNPVTLSTHVGAVASSNAKVTIYEGYAKTYAADFSGNTFSPYIWNGILYYIAEPSSTDTLASMQSNSHALRSIFAAQAAYANPGLSYDCAVFDENGVGFAAFGRYTNVSGNTGTASFSGVLAGAYRVNPKLRIGGFIEKYASDIKTGSVKISNTNPDCGVFGVWSQTKSGEGLKFRAAFRYGKHQIKITRDLIGDAEPGAGESNLQTQGAQLTLSNSFSLKNSKSLSPYAGVRYVNISRAAYTETTTATVTNPLTYDQLRQETASVLFGVNLAATLNHALSVSSTGGFEHDISQQFGHYTATGVYGLGAINFSDDTRKTRMFACAEVAYKIDPTHQLILQVFYREEAYGSISTTTAMVTYSVGF